MNSASRKKEYEELTGLPYKSAPTTAGNGGGLERSTAAAATAVANNWTTKNDLANQAVSMIIRVYRSFRMKKVFKELRDKMLTTEQAFTTSILKKVCPKEMELLKDPFIQGRVRFRMGGSSFPPNIYFKIFTKCQNVHYFSGSVLIEPGSQAAMDSCSVMGRRKFLEQLVVEEQYLQKKLSPVEVTNRKEFIQYMSAVDDRPTHEGGRNNGWREINLKYLPNDPIIYDLETLQRALKKATISQISIPRAGSRQKKKRHVSTSQRIRLTKMKSYLTIAAEMDSHHQTKKEQLQGSEEYQNFYADNEDESEDEFTSMYEWSEKLNPSFDPFHDYLAKV